MNDGLKQRMIGAIVLVALAIVFIPVIFDENQTRPKDIFLDIPEQPAITIVPIEKPERPKLDDTKPGGSQDNLTPGSAEPATSQQPIGKAELFDETNMPFSWTLQLATFQEQQNAEDLRDNLRKSGYKSYLKIDRTVEPVLSRVFVGPDLDYDRLTELQNKLKKELELDGFIVRFLP